MADNKTTATELLERLHNMAIFRLSLGSKELFHSNFLEYLWDCKRNDDGSFDRKCFISMIRMLFNDENILNGPVDKYILSREKENFDVCIFHKTGTRDVYDLIIENKVKSIPYKEQLAEYVGKVADKKQEKSPAYLLLSLAKDFPDKEDEEIKDTWKVVHYGTLRDAIWAQEKWRSEPFVEEYCDFIKTLDELGAAILDGMDREYLFPNVEDYKKERLHDLYIKMRCSWFATALKTELGKNIDKRKIRIVSKYEERLPDCVNLNVAMNQGNGQIAAWICDCNMNTFEIVIQGDQYRHGINQIGIKKSKSKEIENDYYQVKENDRAFFNHFVLNWLYGRLEKLQDVNAYNFLNFLDHFNCFNSNQSDIRPESKKEKVYYFRKTKTPKAGPFDCYSDDYIYRYVSISNCTVQTLRDKMLNDILRIFHNLPDLS